MTLQSHGIHRLIRWTLVLFFCLSGPFLAFAQAPIENQEETARISGAKSTVPFVDRFLKSDQPIHIEAGHLSYNNETGIWRAEGNVLITQDDIELRADFILIDMKNKSLAADGDVMLKNQEGRLRSDSIFLNLDAEIGVIVRGSLVVHQAEQNFYFTGDRIEKTGPSRYRITNGTYSACDCQAGEEADWIIEAKQIDLTLDGYAVIRHGRYVSFGEPVAWIPYGVFPSKVTRQSGFLSPEIGWSNDDGYNGGIPYYWAIDPHNDMTIDTRLYETRGLKEGLEYRYAFSQRWKGRFDFDFLPYDHRFGSERWAVAYEHQQNIWRRLYLRANINTVSDNDYVVDFPSDISARYDSFLRSNVIANYLWEYFDLNVDFEQYDNLTREDNASTWQRLPEARFNGILFPFLGPLSTKFDVTATRFERQKPLEEESELDEIAGNRAPYLYLSEGQRYEVTPELIAPLSFRRYAYLTPRAGGYGAFDYLAERQTDVTPSRVLYFTGADLHTELERVFPVFLPHLRGLKHSFSPGVSYLYFPDSHPQDTLPIFDGRDRHFTENVITYYVDNRLWAKLFTPRNRAFSTLKMIDLRFAQDYDFHEAEQKLDPMVENDETRPLSPIRGRLEVTASAGEWIQQILFRSDAHYSLYDDRICTFNIFGAVGTKNDDVIGLEYRYHIIDNSDVVDLDFLNAVGRYTLLEVLTFGAEAKYSFIDDYFIERLYSMQFNSLQNCWALRLELEQREIPQKEIITRLFLDLTGLIGASTAF